MDHLCYNCKASIPEGVAFCPACGSPQIRVSVPEQEPSAQPSGEEPAPQYQPPPQGGPWPQSAPQQPWSPVAIRWDLAWRGALLSGLGAGLLSSVPFISLGCCLWLLTAGGLSVMLYQRQLPGSVITPGMGMKLGALAGLFAFALNAIISTMSFVVLHATDFREQMQQQIHRALQRNPDPDVQKMAQQLLDKLSTPQGIATLFVLMLGIVAVGFLIFTAAGGAIGASMFSRRRELR